MIRRGSSLLLTIALVASFVFMVSDAMAAKQMWVGGSGVSGSYGHGKTEHGNYDDSTGGNASGHAERSSPDNTGLNNGSNDETAHAVAAMDAAQKKVEHTFEASAEWEDAARAFTKARNDYEAARAAVIKTLHDKPAYQAALTASQKADQALADIRKNDSAKPEDRMAAASAALDAHSALTKMETDACAADANVASTKKALADAAAAMSQLRQKEHAAVLADADWQAAKAHFDEVKAKTTAANSDGNTGSGPTASSGK
jgi:hypothetical protein